jgi:hypothetical protein
MDSVLPTIQPLLLFARMRCGGRGACTQHAFSEAAAFFPEAKPGEVSGVGYWLLR